MFLHLSTSTSHIQQTIIIFFDDIFRVLRAKKSAAQHGQCPCFTGFFPFLMYEMTMPASIFFLFSPQKNSRP